MPATKRTSLTQEFSTLLVDHAAMTADVTTKLVKFGRRARLVGVRYVNPTGLAADNANAFRVSLLSGADEAAMLFNTDGDDDPAGASLPANTWVEGALSPTDSYRVFEAGDELDLVFDEDGTATLPAGHLQIDLIYF